MYSRPAVLPIMSSAIGMQVCAVTTMWISCSSMSKRKYFTLTESAPKPYVNEVSSVTLANREREKEKNTNKRSLKEKKGRNKHV